MQDCPDSARVVVADQLARSTLLADNLRVTSKVHPEYTTTYHGGNWPEDEQVLVRRGDVTLWLSAEAMDAWRPAPSGRPGGPRKFSDVSLMTALLRRLVFRLPAIRDYQRARRTAGAAAATVNRETSALSRMFQLAVRSRQLPECPVFPERLEENGPRQGFFEHAEYAAVRQQLPAPYQDVLDFAYYSGWRKREILDLRWDEVDEAGEVVRLSPHRSKTRVGRVLPISPPIAAVLARRRTTRRAGDMRVFHRDDVTVRAWRTAWPAACRQAGVPGRLLHDCRRTTARNLVRAGVPERVAMQWTGHKTRAVFDRYNIVQEAELHEAGTRLLAYLATQPAARRSREMTAAGS